MTLAAQLVAIALLLVLCVAIAARARRSSEFERQSLELHRAIVELQEQLVDELTPPIVRCIDKLNELVSKEARPRQLLSCGCPPGCRCTTCPQCVGSSAVR